MKKRIAVLIRRTPFNTVRNMEGLRMSLGITLQDDEVTVIFMDEGVRHAGKLLPDIVGAKDTMQEIEMLQALDCRLIAEDESISLRDVELLEGIEKMPEAEIARMLPEFDIVVPW